jgi:orotate phosphoribosyltransferase
MYTQEQVLEIFARTGVLLEGHFRLTSGLHAAKYLQCAQLLQYPHEAGPLCEQLASYFKDAGATVVAGPATGGIILAYEVAKALGVKNIFGERENGVMTFRRGFKLEPTDKVLVLEDVVTTGGSVKELIACVKEAGAEVVGVASLVNRSGGRVDFGVPFKSLVNLDITTYQPEECPMCKEGSVAYKPGSRQV